MGRAHGKTGHSSGAGGKRYRVRTERQARQISPQAVRDLLPGTPRRRFLSGGRWQGGDGSVVCTEVALLGLYVLFLVVRVKLY